MPGVTIRRTLESRTAWEVSVKREGKPVTTTRHPTFRIAEKRQALVLLEYKGKDLEWVALGVRLIHGEEACA